MSTTEIKTNSSKTTSKGSVYRLGVGERKLPRPVVFWSDNEKDAFRRNKIVQTRYTMMIDDIENQRRSSAKNIRHESHKIRVRSSKYRVENKSSQNSKSACDDNSSLKTKTKDKSLSDSNDDDLSDSASETEESKVTVKKYKAKEGIITKHRKPSVKFSVYKEFIPDDADTKSTGNKGTVSQNDGLILRSLSARQPRAVPELRGNTSVRSHSALPTSLINRLSVNDSSRPTSSNRKASTVSFDSAIFSSDNGKKPRPRSSLFFDKSVAAFELRRELQRLARLRKTSVVSAPYTISDALRDEREKYSQSRDKVQEYIKKLETIKRESLVVNKWTQGEVEQSLNLQ